MAQLVLSHYQNLPRVNPGHRRHRTFTFINIHFIKDIFKKESAEAKLSNIVMFVGCGKMREKQSTVTSSGLVIPGDLVDKV